MRYRTGAVTFDQQLHGGLPAGLIEISGEDSSGKTALALSVAREAGLTGLPCALVHMQGGPPDTDFLRSAGISNLAVSTPPYGEAAIEMAYTCLSRGFRVVIIDSFSNVRPRCEDDLMVGDRSPGGNRLAHHGAKMLREVAQRTDSVAILLSEVRANLNGFGLISAYESVLRGTADFRVRLRRIETHAEYGTVRDVTVRMSVLSSTTFSAGVEGEVRLRGSRGVYRNMELLLALVRADLLRPVGAYWRGLSGMFGPGYERAARQVGQRYEQYREELV